MGPGSCTVRAAELRATVLEAGETSSLETGLPGNRWGTGHPGTNLIATGRSDMERARSTHNEDTTDRVAEITETWEASPLTEPQLATDSKASSPAVPGFKDDSRSDLVREGERESRTDH
jgi:hypothetical protein